MKNKKRIFITLCGIISIVVVIVIIVINNGMFATAEYSNEYNKIIGEFTANTTSELLKQKKENTCYSPISMFSALALTAECAEGKTQEEIYEALGVDDIEKIEETCKKMESALELKHDIDSEEITLCNSLWIQEDYLQEDSVDIINRNTDKLNCEIFQCDSLETKLINEWVSNKTNDLIEDIVDENKMEYACVLVNALYYESVWAYTLVESTEKEDFTLENDERVQTSYLEGNEINMDYKLCEKYTIVSVPLVSGDFIVVLPKEGMKLSKLLTESKINEVMSIITNKEMDRGSVNIKIPTFECMNSFEEELEVMMKKMGIKSLYENSEWRLSERLNNQEVKVVQKNKITVSKDGVKAASASYAGFPLGANPEKLMLDINFDRPFLYIIMKDGVPLFIGTVYNPAE